MNLRNINFTLNGEETSIYANPGELLVDVLRDKFLLKGTKIGCKTGGCGACTVILDGRAVNSCMIPLGKVEGRSVTTVEGISEEGQLHPIQEALIDNGAVQCGFCFSGIVASGKALYDLNPHANEHDVRKALEGNICRCTGFIKIEEAVLKAIRQKDEVV